jgi:hypothetical protein
MHNALPPDRMSSDERLAEAARLLAAGFLRLRRGAGATSVTPVEQSPFRLDFSPAESGRREPDQSWETKR